MGHAIYYCTGCSTQLRDPDFEKGAAFRFEGRVFCKACAPESVRAQASARIPKVAPAERKTVGDNTSRILKVGPPPPESPRSEGNTKWILAAAGAGVVLLLVVAMSTGGKEPPRPHEPPPPPVVQQLPAPPPPAPPTRDERPAEEALRKARDFAATHPSDFVGQVALFDAAVLASADTGHHAAALRERDAAAARQKTFLKTQIDALHAALRAATGAEDFRAATRLLDEARAKSQGPEWVLEVERQTQAANEAVQKLFAAAKAAAVDARKKANEDEVKRQTQRVEKWGVDSMQRDLAAAVAAATPRPKPPPPAPPKEIDTYRKRWTEAMAAGSVRDFAGAQKKIEDAKAAAAADAATQAEAAADLELLRLAISAEEEALQAVSRIPKGAKLTVTALTDAGKVEMTGTVARNERHELELAREKGSVRIPLGEISSRTLGQAIKGRNDKGAALLCVLDGDLEGGKSLLDSPAVLPDKYWSFKAPPTGPAQTAARKIFYAAERESGVHAKAGDVSQKYAALLKTHADTEFVRRNRATIAARMERLRDLYFLADDLQAAGSFKPAKGEKDDFFWKSQAEGDPSRPAESYVELAFSALPEAEYRCWAWIGGCCSEAITFSLQVSETAAEPGGESVVPSKHLMSMPFKTHAAHEGRGRPSPKWGWVQIPLPKFAAAGLKKIRIVAVHQGFCVAHAVVSSSRQTPPPPAETKDLERARIESRGAARVDPTLVGHWKLADGSGTAAADSSPSGIDGKLVKGGTWTPGSPPSLKLQGGAYVSLGTNLPLLQNVNAVTMSAWIYPEGLAANDEQNNILSLSRNNNGAPTNESRASMALVNSGKVVVSARSSDTGKLQSARTADKIVKTGAWVHVAATIDYAGETLTVYVNGVAQPVTGTVKFGEKSTPSTTCQSGTIGAEDDGSRFYFHGRLADLRLYSRALSREEIAELAVPPGSLR